MSSLGEHEKALEHIPPCPMRFFFSSPLNSYTSFRNVLKVGWEGSMKIRIPTKSMALPCLSNRLPSIKPKKIEALAQAKLCSFSWSNPEAFDRDIQKASLGPNKWFHKDGLCLRCYATHGYTAEPRGMPQLQKLVKKTASATVLLSIWTAGLDRGGKKEDRVSHGYLYKERRDEK